MADLGYQMGRVARRGRRSLNTVKRQIFAVRWRLVAPRLVSTHLIDGEWLSLQAGADFGSDAAAARWFLGKGARAGASPHRLFELDWIDPTGAMAARPRVPALQEAAASSRAHPLIDHAGGFSAVVEGLNSETPLTLEGVTVTYADWCRRIDDAQAVLADHARLRAPLVRRHWDLDADAEYVKTWSRAPIDEAAGPLVSVVMPVRNRPTLVVEAVKSVQRQTLSSWELLVVDDGSDDETPEVIEALSAADPRIKLVRRAHEGVSAARNAGIDEARAPYIAFLDSDNEWTSHYLKVAVASMQDQDLQVAFAVVDLIDEHGHRYLTFDGDADHLKFRNFVDLNVLVARAALIREVGGFDRSLRRMVDYDLVWRLSERAPLTLLPFIGVHYAAQVGAHDRITTTESLAWDYVVKARNMVRWTELEATVSDRLQHRISVVVPARLDREAAVRTVRSVLPVDVADDSVEVVVVDDNSSSGMWRLLTAEVGLDPRVRLMRTPAHLHRAAAASLGLQETSGTCVVVVPAGTTFEPGGLVKLIEPVRSGTASVAIAGGADLTLAWDAATALAMRGLDPVFVDEFEVADLRARLEAAGHVVTEVDQVTALVESYDVPEPARHRDNVREWQRRWSDTPVPTARRNG